MIGGPLAALGPCHITSRFDQIVHFKCFNELLLLLSLDTLHNGLCLLFWIPDSVNSGWLIWQDLHLPLGVLQDIGVAHTLL